MTGEADDSRSDEILAAEYAIGVLPHGERQAFAARLEREPDLAREVRFWDEKLIDLADGIEPATPPAALFSALEEHLFADEASGAAAAPPASRPGFFNSLAFWRGLSLAAGAAAIVFAVLFVNEVRAPDAPGMPVGASYVAELTGETGAVRLVALYDARSGTMRINRIKGTAPQGRAFELWLIDGDKDAVSLGVLPDSPMAALTVPEALRDGVSDGILAISDEPAGGSQTGLPTGPVLAAGKVVTI